MYVYIGTEEEDSYEGVPPKWAKILKEAAAEAGILGCVFVCVYTRMCVCVCVCVCACVVCVCVCTYMYTLPSLSLPFSLARALSLDLALSHTHVHTHTHTHTHRCEGTARRKEDDQDAETGG